MELLYKQEHLSCLNYEKGPRPAVQVMELKEKRAFSEQSLLCKIIIVRRGKLSFSLGVSSRGTIAEGQIMCLPPCRQFRLTAEKNSIFLIIRLEKPIRFCECYALDKLTHETENLFSVEEIPQEKKPYLLETNAEIDTYIESLLMAINKGLLCKNYFGMKVKELFYLFRAFYRKEEVAMFFRELLSREFRFSYLVIHNYRKYKTASELAAALNMTLWTFEKSFKKAFGMPAYKWMKEQKAKEIYNAICSEQTPFKTLALRFGFASKSSFSEFCSRNLGDSPGAIRKKYAGG